MENKIEKYKCLIFRANSSTEALHLALQPILFSNINSVRNITEILVHADNVERHYKALN